MGPRLRVESKLVVRLSNRLADRGFHERLARESVGDPCGARSSTVRTFRSGSGLVTRLAWLYALA